MSTLYLIRHGITRANRENRFAGRTDEELHPEGIEQIRAVGRQLLQKDIRAIYTGPSRRTKQSGAILGSILEIPLTGVEGLNEIYIPHWDGLTKDEIREKYAGEYPSWLDSPESFQLSGCENLDQVQSRAVQAVERLIDHHYPDNLLIVSHLIVLRCLYLYYSGLAMKDFRSVKIGNGVVLQLKAPAKSGKRLIEFL